MTIKVITLYEDRNIFQMTIKPLVQQK